MDERCLVRPSLNNLKREQRHEWFVDAFRKSRGPASSFSICSRILAEVDGPGPNDDGFFIVVVCGGNNGNGDNHCQRR